MKKSGKYIYVLGVTAFILNWIWEMGQMFAFEIKPETGGAKIFVFCTLASVVDALATIGIYGALKKIGIARPTAFYLPAAALGAGLAVGFEFFASRFELWKYSDNMPVVPILEVGLLPFAQLTLLVPLAIWLATHFSGEARNKRDALGKRAGIFAEAEVFSPLRNFNYVSRNFSYQ